MCIYTNTVGENITGATNVLIVQKKKIKDQLKISKHTLFYKDTETKTTVLDI